MFLPNGTPLGTSGFRDHTHTEGAKVLAEARHQGVVLQGTRHHNLWIVLVLLSARLRPMTQYGSVILEEMAVAQLQSSLSDRPDKSILTGPQLHQNLPHTRIHLTPACPNG